MSAILFRGLIPAGFMPATARVARQGTLLMACSHGEMKMQAPGAGEGKGKRAVHAGVEQCPFGAAMGPALLAALPSLALPVAVARRSQAWVAVTRRGLSPRLQPPPRGPPRVS